MSKRRVPLTRRRKFRFKVYKVLHRMQWSNNRLTGGHTDFDWTPYLPKDGKPGALCKLSTRRALKLCYYGLHVTTRPQKWTVYGAGHVRIFEVAVYGPIKGKFDGNGHSKICAYRVRLLREVRYGTSEWNTINRWDYDPYYFNRGGR